MKRLLLALVVLVVAGVALWRFSEVFFPPAAPVGTTADGSAPQTPGEVSAQREATAREAEGGPTTATATAVAELLVPTLTEVPSLLPAAPFVPQDNTLLIDLSEYAGYAGLLLANGGTEPSEQSYFFQKHGFKVKVKLSEEESWSPLNSGAVAASASTVDVLAVYARQLQATVPVLLSYSRGADAIVVQPRINRINDLRGQTLVACQFTETEFFLRYLAQDAGLPVKALALGERPDPQAVNLRFTAEAFGAGDAFLADLQSGRPQFGGFVSWEPKVSEVVEAANGRAKTLVTNRNLLIIADILMLNRAFARQNPKLVEGLVEGILWGNSQVRENPAQGAQILSKVYGWTASEAAEELKKVHLANHPENIGFFEGTLDAAGTFGAIYQASLFAYGDIAKHDVPWERMVDTRPLKAVAGTFAGQVAQIEPIRMREGGSLEENPLLARDIRFFFEPNSSVLAKSAENDQLYDLVLQMLRVSPGSTVLLRGHVDNARIEEFRKQGGDSLVRSQSQRAMQLSRERAQAVREHLVNVLKVDAARVDVVGRGWEEPVGTDGNLNRRVEVFWYTLE